MAVLHLEGGCANEDSSETVTFLYIIFWNRQDIECIGRFTGCFVHFTIIVGVVLGTAGDFQLHSTVAAAEAGHLDGVVIGRRGGCELQFGGNMDINESVIYIVTIILCINSDRPILF